MARSPPLHPALSLYGSVFPSNGRGNADWSSRNGSPLVIPLPTSTSRKADAAEKMQEILREEKDNSEGFLKLPRHFIEISKAVLDLYVSTPHTSLVDLKRIGRRPIA